jgi:hypothetical protein
LLLLLLVVLQPCTAALLPRVLPATCASTVWLKCHFAAAAACCVAAMHRSAAVTYAASNVRINCHKRLVTPLLLLLLLLLLCCCCSHAPQRCCHVCRQQCAH